MTDKRVPREPSDAMCQAGYDLGRYPHPEKLWRAMYDAAPAAPDERDRGSRAWCVWDDCDGDAVYCEGHAKEYAAPTINALRAERDALKAALRKHVIYRAESVDSGPWVMCRICLRKWSALDAERHAPSCLAATEDAP